MFCSRQGKNQGDKENSHKGLVTNVSIGKPAFERVVNSMIMGSAKHADVFTTAV